MNLRRRPPDFVIGRPEAPYMLRWWLTERRPDVWRAYLHKFLRDDDDRALHDHPADSISIILWGGYLEHLTGGRVKRRWPGTVVFRRATLAHRIELHRDKASRPIPAWTIFIFSPNVREWGFHCPKGWVHWRDFTAADNSGGIGRGCD